MIRTEPTNITDPMSKGEAKALTDRIRHAVDGLWALLLEAHERKAWKVLGYATWEEYVSQEFSMSRQRSYQLLDQGRVIVAIREATGDLSTSGRQSEKGRGHTRTLSLPGDSVDISERDARDLKPILPAVTAEIRAKVEAGAEPKKAVADTVAAARAEKERQREEKAVQQAEHDRQREEVRAALPPSVQRVEQAKQRNGATNAAVAGVPAADRIAELEDAVRALEAENARLKEENKLFAEMKAEWEKGGFAEVIAGKDAVIAAQASRIERESGDKASWKRVSDMWKQRALDSGWSNEVAIDIETGAVVNGH